MTDNQVRNELSAERTARLAAEEQSALNFTKIIGLQEELKAERTKREGVEAVCAEFRELFEVWKNGVGRISFINGDFVRRWVKSTEALANIYYPETGTPLAPGSAILEQRRSADILYAEASRHRACCGDDPDGALDSAIAGYKANSPGSSIGAQLRAADELKQFVYDMPDHDDISHWLEELTAKARAYEAAKGGKGLLP